MLFVSRAARSGYTEFCVEGSYPVHLTGYYMPDFDEDDDDGPYADMEDEDDEDDSEEDDEDDQFGMLEDFDEDEDEDDEDEEEGVTRRGGVTIEELEEPKKKAAPAKKEPASKKRAAEEKAEPPAKKAAKEAPAKKEPAAVAKKEEPAASTPGKKEMKREFKNGMEIVNTTMGKPDGKQAKPGKRVSMKYIGKLPSGKVFDQTKGKDTFAFRLGVGEVIKGWDVGVDGMRVGDKRRLTIPPAMAYGKKGVKGAIPPNSTLVFDVELVNVQ